MSAPDVAERRARLAALHVPGSPLLLPNAWDLGSARVLADLGYAAVATTSSGFAASLGRDDGEVSRDEAVEHGAALAAGVAVPVTADLENGFADDPAGVAEVIAGVASTGLAGCSVEDFTRDESDPIYPFELAVERIAAAVSTADGLVLTARAEGFLHGRTDLDDVVGRLVAFAAAGAQVVYAPGLTQRAQIAEVVAAVPVPVNVLLMPGGPGVAELADLGVARISVGGGFAFAAYGALAQYAGALLTDGELQYQSLASRGREATSSAFGT